MAHTWSTSGSWNFFRSDSTSGAHSSFVGTETPSGTRLNRVGRTSFTTPNAYIGKISFTSSYSSTYPYIWDNTGGTSLCWAISTDPNAYIHANGTVNGYHGTCTVVATGSSRYIASASAVEIQLQPNTTYYLFIYPNNTASYAGYMLDSTGKFTMTGEDAGQVRIYTSSGWVNATPYVYTSSGWQRAIPYVYTSSGWTIAR